jgi:hypothetical protein
MDEAGFLADIRPRSSETRWQEIAAIRDRLIHGCSDFDLRRGWNIAQRDQAELKGAAQRRISEDPARSRSSRSAPRRTSLLDGPLPAPYTETNSTTGSPEIGLRGGPGALDPLNLIRFVPA